MSPDHSLTSDSGGCVLYIKYMVCSRGIRVVRCELESLGLRVLAVRLGAATVAGPAQELDWVHIRAALAAAGFALLENPQHVLAARVKRVVNELLRRPGTLRHPDFIPTLAQEVGVSARQLHRLFARLPGHESLLSYVTHQRLAYAQELLGASPLGIGRLARLLGYGSLAHFSGQFRRFARCAPSAYRQQLLSTAEAAALDAEAPNSASRRANNVKPRG
ncbi:helix-turn-helix domain-containing protein [Hymenobacter caeli]|uniref:Transcriptional regulator GlxA family with amidase domain n=1 Tax=Hymenobacter caeli TaxID=2735894 RepID=A0ABX2FUW4_9BACT|nr:AraC family transcriptional regulator [Hymenobacter caeli]NRT20980.1 transcriptional regulator GlxA family with amidase domain [Hymenobacter caeli]